MRPDIRQLFTSCICRGYLVIAPDGPCPGLYAKLKCMPAEDLESAASVLSAAFAGFREGMLSAPTKVYTTAVRRTKRKISIRNVGQVMHRGWRLSGSCRFSPCRPHNKFIEREQCSTTTKTKEKGDFL